MTIKEFPLPPEQLLSKEITHCRTDTRQGHALWERAVSIGCASINRNWCFPFALNSSRAACEGKLLVTECRNVSPGPRHAAG